MEEELDIEEIRLKSPEELSNVLVSLRKELVDMVFQRKLSQFNNVARFKLVKKIIARVLTILNEKRGN